VEDGVYFFSCRRDASRADAGVLPDFLIEFGRAVVLPKVAEDFPEGIGAKCFRGVGVGGAVKSLVNVGDGRRRELTGPVASRSGDETFCGLIL
jgi:hypothetical protein